MTSDPTTGAHAMLYDAENRQVSYTKAGVTTTYVYDGDGRRVKKLDSTGTIVFVYDVGGLLIAEYHSDPVPPPAGGGGTSYLTSDHLGSTRVVTKQDGTVKARYDYLPFGEELGAAIGQRTAGLGYSAADSTKHKFTQKERDAESGLDYFLARYYSSAQGRFTSPDDFINATHVSEPQSWNLYGYVGNNPLRFVDPTGQIKTNADGTVTFDPDKVDKKTGKPKDAEYIYFRKVGADGSITTTKWRAVKGSIYADNGAKITAYKATTAVSVEVTNANGFVNQKESTSQTAALSGSDNSSDCHGNTFAQGQVWIENDQVKKIIQNDGYRPLADGEAAQRGDVGIYAEGKKFDLGKTQHSVLVNSVLNGSVQDVLSKGGITNRAIRPPGPGGGLHGIQRTTTLTRKTHS